MQSFRLDTNNNKQFIFKFSLKKDDSGGCKYGSRSLSFELMRNDIPSDILSFNWEGCLSLDPTVFDLRFGDEVDIRGSIRLFRVNGEESDYIFLDAHYGYEIENHF